MQTLKNLLQGIPVWTLVLTAALFVSFDRYQANLVFAQDEGDAAADEAADEAPKGKKAAAAEGETETKASEQSWLGWLIYTSGFIGAVLLVLSIYFVATTVTMFYELRKDVLLPPQIVDECEELMKKKDPMGMYRLLKKDTSFFSTVLTAGLTDLPLGLPESRESMDRAGEVLVVEMEKKISMLAVLGSLGPMIGLLGTLKGMIASFSVIAMSDTQLKASEVAGGISEALVLTFEGVALSVPAIYFFSVFKNKISHLTSTVMLSADDYIRRIFAASRAKPVAAAAAPSAGGQT